MNESGKSRSDRKVRSGIVVSDKMTSTVTVQLERRFAHPLYQKQITTTKRVKAHDGQGAQVGDVVRIMETRPLSKTKRWRVIAIVRRAQ